MAHSKPVIRPASIDLLLRAFLLFSICADVSASWRDQDQGLPLIEVFRPKTVGDTFRSFAMAQDGRGRMYFGGEELRVYDGDTWQRFALPENDSIVAMHWGTDGRLWVGGTREIGYFEETPEGGFAFTSLRPQLPSADEDEPDIVWGVGQVGERIYFVCKTQVLCWDGQRITVTPYPTSTRLFPVKLGDELWFTHQETGLYRLLETGPKLEFPAQALPPSAPFHLFRVGQEIRLIANEGIFAVGQPDVPLSGAAFNRFGREGLITSVVSDRAGNYYASSLNDGIAVFSQQGDLIRILGPEIGLPGKRVNALFVDREGSLWSAAGGGFSRIENPGAAGIFNEQAGLKRGSISNLALQGSALLLQTESGIFQLQAAPGNFAHFTARPQLTDPYFSALAFDAGLLLAKFSAIVFADARGLHTVFEKRSATFHGLTLSKRESRSVFFLAERNLHRLSRSASGAWQQKLFATAPESIRAIWESPQGELWANCAKAGIFRYVEETRQMTRFEDDLPRDGNAAYVALAGHGDSLFFSRNNACYRIDAGSSKPALVGQVPAASFVRAIAPSPSGDRLYVTFERAISNSQLSFGVGYFLLTGDNRPARWHELGITRLDAIGSTNSIFAHVADGADALWICGTEGVMRLRPNDLPSLGRPAMPFLRLLGPSAAESLASLDFPFKGHHIELKVTTPESAPRKNLRFQTRLGDADAPWSDALARSSFEFTNLSEGTYTFAVRSVNLAGMTSEPASFTFRILPPWFRTQWAYTSYATILTLGVFGLVRLRERRARARTRELERVVTERTTELVKANAAKDEFLAGISHEIRNPMNGVVGLASAIDASTLDATSQQRFASLRYCAAHLSSLLDDVLDFSKLQAGAIALEPRPFQLPELVQSIAAITSVESAQAGIPIEIAVSPAVPRHLVGDASRIRQILLNLVINAVKYSGRGKVCLTVWSRQTIPDTCQVTFAVSDEGPGISPSEQTRLFTRFERGPAARQQHVAGTGLGLALCKTLAEKMGGSLTVESETGRGSVFSLIVTLPVAADSPPVLRPAIATQLPAVFRALVVDDEEYNRIALAAMLEELGFSSVTAADADNAVAAARAQKFDAVFLDFDLPDKNGPEIARELRALPGFPADLPVIATTAFNTPEKRALCFAAGMNAFVSKPISLDKLRSALAAATSLGRPTASLHVPHATDGEEPLANLLLLANRKGVSTTEEFALYLRELDEEILALEVALQQRLAAEAARAAHRLTGRFAFIHAQPEEKIAREIETAAAHEAWPHADAAWLRLCAQISAIRERLKRPS